MATRFQSGVVSDNATDANMRVWVQFIEDTLVATGGWVVTSDTGQTLPSAIVHPTVANTKQGYRIYRMADSLQATFPVFMRIDFGSSANVASPAFWVTIGTGSNGSGTITGILWNGGASATPNVANTQTTTNQNCYGSASTGRASIALFISSAASDTALVFTIERTKDASGVDTGDGLLLVYNQVSSSLNVSRYIIYAGGAQPTAETGLSYILTQRNPSETFAPGDLGVGILIHFKGVAQQPGTNVMIVNSSDVGAEGSFSLTLYGATRTYQHLNGRMTVTKAVAGSTAADLSARVCIRFD